MGAFDDLIPGARTDDDDSADFGPFADLVPRKAAREAAGDFGPFADLVPDVSPRDDAAEFGPFGDLVPRRAPAAAASTSSLSRPAPLVPVDSSATDPSPGLPLDDAAARAAPFEHVPGDTTIASSTLDAGNRRLAGLPPLRPPLATPAPGAAPKLGVPHLQGANLFADLIPSAVPGLPEARRWEPSYWERLVGAFQQHAGLSENLGQLVSDLRPSRGPLTEEIREARRARRREAAAREADRLGLEPLPAFADLPEDAPLSATLDLLTAKSAEVIGAMAKEAADPLAFAAGAIGAGARGLDRVLKLAGAGGAYEGLSASVEQLASEGEITSPGDVGMRAALGAVAAPTFDAVLRGIASGIRRLLNRRGTPDAIPTQVDVDIEAGVRAVAEEAERAGVSPRLALTQLIDMVERADGPVAVPRRDVFDSPGEEIKGVAAVESQLPVTEATPATVPSAETSPTLADEYARLADAALDPAIRDELLQRAALVREQVQRNPLRAQQQLGEERLAEPSDGRPSAAGELVDDPLTYTESTRERGAPDVPEPAGVAADPGRYRRGGDAVPGQLELFTREGDAADTLAAFDAFGPRVRYTVTGRLPTSTRRVSTAADVAHVAAGIRKEPQETILAIVTDDAGDILRIARHTVGTPDASQADPGLLAAVAHRTPGARHAWFVHQHPSGFAEQSNADRALTTKLHEILRDTGITPRGMVVVAPQGRFTHYHPDPAAAQQATPARIPAAPRRDALDIESRRFTRLPSSEKPIYSPAGMRMALERFSTGREGVMLLDTRHQPVGFLPMSASDMLRLRQGEGSPAGALLRALDESNAMSLAAVVESPNPDTLSQVHGNLTAFASANARRHLDTINADGVSAAEQGIAYQPTTFYANPFNQAVKFGARTLRNHTAAGVAGGLAGGMGGGMKSDEEPGSARWWADVGFGAALGALGGASFIGMVKHAGLFGEGSLADRGQAAAGRFLGKLFGRGPGELEEMKRLRRQMRMLLDRQTGEVGTFLRDKFTPSERALMADLIENRGIVPDLNRVHTQAAALDDYLSFITQKMKAYKMLPPDVEEGGYLHRYYAKHLGVDKTFQEAKRQSLSGSYTIARGMVDTFGREYLSPGAQAITDQVERLLAEKSLLERGMFETAIGKAQGAAMSVDAAVIRTAEIDDALKALRGQELVEMVGEQNGQLHSFFFTRDEVGRVDGDPVLARLQGDRTRPAPAGAGAVPQLEAPLLQPSPGRVGGIQGELPASAGPRAPNVEALSPTDRVWTVKTTSESGVKLRRDWTRRERDSWGEIRDAAYRYTRGMAEASHDLSLAKLFHDVSRKTEWVSDTPQLTKEGEWHHVPTVKARPSASLEKYGALAGRYVRPDVWRALKNHGVAPRVLGGLGDMNLPGTGTTVIQAYREALSRWKLWHTVYNPGSHLNNSYSNIEMFSMGGYSAQDLARGLREMMRGEQGTWWREARDAGLLDTDFGSAELRDSSGSPLMRLAEEIRLQRDEQDATLLLSPMMRVKEWWIQSEAAVSGAQGWRSGAELAKALARPVGASFRRIIKPPVAWAARSMQGLYRLEDNIFKMAVFAAERRVGASVDQARRKAQELFFDYSDLPDSIRAVRDFPIGAPFISYTYKAIPAVVRNITRNPERVLALIMAYEAANFAMLVSAGMDPDQYFEVMDAYEDTLPPWDSGRSLWGARNFLVLPGADNLLALGRMHAVGNPFMSDAGERRAAIPGVTAFWGSDIFGGNPIRALLDVLMNEDWRGKEIYREADPFSTKMKKRAAYLYQAWAPSNVLVPGGYHQSKVLEGLANDVREDRESIAAPLLGAANATAEALGMQQFTGLDRAGNEIDAGQALAGSFGLKVRDIRTRESAQFEFDRLERGIANKERAIRDEARKRAEGRISDRAFEDYRNAVMREIEALNAEGQQISRAIETLKSEGLAR